MRAKKKKPPQSEKKTSRFYHHSDSEYNAYPQNSLGNANSFNTLGAMQIDSSVTIQHYNNNFYPQLTNAGNYFMPQQANVNGFSMQPAHAGGFSMQQQIKPSSVPFSPTTALSSLQEYSRTEHAGSVVGISHDGTHYFSPPSSPELTERVSFIPSIGSPSFKSHEQPDRISPLIDALTQSSRNALGLLTTTMQEAILNQEPLNQYILLFAHIVLIQKKTKHFSQHNLRSFLRTLCSEKLNDTKTYFSFNKMISTLFTKHYQLLSQHYNLNGIHSALAHLTEKDKLLVDALKYPDTTGKDLTNIYYNALLESITQLLSPLRMALYAELESTPYYEQTCRLISTIEYHLSCLRLSELTQKQNLAKLTTTYHHWKKATHQAQRTKDAIKTIMQWRSSHLMTLTLTHWKQTTLQNRNNRRKQQLNQMVTRHVRNQQKLAPARTMPFPQYHRQLQIRLNQWKEATYRARRINGAIKTIIQQRSFHLMPLMWEHWKQMTLHNRDETRNQKLNQMITQHIQFQRTRSIKAKLTSLMERRLLQRNTAITLLQTIEQYRLPRALHKWVEATRQGRYKEERNKKFNSIISKKAQNQLTIAFQHWNTLREQKTKDTKKRQIRHFVTHRFDWQKGRIFIGLIALPVFFLNADFKEHNNYIDSFLLASAFTSISLAVMSLLPTLENREQRMGYKRPVNELLKTQIALTSLGMLAFVLWTVKRYLESDSPTYAARDDRQCKLSI